ncbi:DUF4157 domain-containing protein [Mesorhizobium sp. M1233]|uniref:eCIS core domain-containing protein n=1 Tax=Mesorhizobium sp. M1233 TaxID=2957072 RepID=UPI00333A26E7
MRSLGPGRPLPPGERAFFEPRFNRDLGRVRLHDGLAADAAATSIGARAFALGNSIAFASGEYRPGTGAGRQLLAHELAHVSEGHAERDIRRATTRGAGGCGPQSSIDEDDDGPRQAGLIAHTQIQAALLTSGVLNELEVPRATKRKIASTGCQPAGTHEGYTDLFRLGPGQVELAEIKPIYRANTLAVEEVEHYIRRSGQAQDRVTKTGRCSADPPTVGEDDVFDRQVRSFRSGSAKPAFTKLNGVLPATTVIGPFDGDRARTLKARLVAPGAVGYWCTGGASETLECGDTLAFDSYIDTILYSVQGEIDKYVADAITGPLDDALKELDARKLLQLGRKWSETSIRQAIADAFGVPLSVIPTLSDATIEQVAVLLDQRVAGSSRDLLRTLAFRIKSILLSHVRNAIRASLRGWIKEILVSLCVTVPAITLAHVIDTIKNRLKMEMPRLVLAAVALAMVDLVSAVVSAIGSALEAIGEFLTKVFIVVGIILVVAAVVVAAILTVLAVFDPVPGDEALLGGLTTVLAQMARQLAASLATGGALAAPAVQN